MSALAILKPTSSVLGKLGFLGGAGNHEPATYGIDTTKIAPSNVYAQTGWVFYGQDAWIPGMSSKWINDLGGFDDKTYHDLAIALGGSDQSGTNSNIKKLAFNGENDSWAANYMLPLSGLVHDNQIFKNIVKIAGYKYGLPVTPDKVKGVNLMWIPQKDFWDKNRGTIAAVVGTVGAALSPFTFGLSAVGGALAAASISKNSQGQSQVTTTTYNPATNQTTTGVSALNPNAQIAGGSNVLPLNSQQPDGNNELYIFLGIGAVFFLMLIFNR